MENYDFLFRKRKKFHTSLELCLSLSLCGLYNDNLTKFMNFCSVTSKRIMFNRYRWADLTTKILWKS